MHPVQFHLLNAIDELLNGNGKFRVAVRRIKC